MRAGLLRHRVAIQTLEATPNEYGELVEEWATVDTVWGAKRDLSGQELFQAQQRHADVTTEWTLRHTDLTAKQQLLHAGTTYDVQSVQDPDGRGRRLIVLTSRAS